MLQVAIHPSDGDSNHLGSFLLILMILIMIIMLRYTMNNFYSFSIDIALSFNITFLGLSS